ncbi:MAG TPA: cache domain-containing protein, partial [Xanthobacteraceae bacterium]|nr:cache domain-containing protein [Xanthobacteraceae bacterium]
MQISLSVTSRLMLLALLAAAPAFAIQAWNEFDLRRARSSEIREQVFRLARTQESEISRVAEGARQFLVALAQVPQIKNAEAAECNELLARIRENYNAYRALIVATADGTVPCSSIGPGPPIADRRYFKGAVRTGDFVSGEYVEGRGTGSPGFHFAYPTRNDSSQVSGVVAAALDLDWFALRLGERLIPGAVLYVADANGTILVRLPENQAWRGRSLPAPIKAAFDSGAAGAVDISEGGRAAILGYVAPASTDSGLFVGVSRETRTAFADLARLSERGALLILAGLAISLVTAWLWGVYGIGQPIQSLLAQVHRWRAGQYATSGVNWGASELGRLGQAFDDLALTVADREQKLRASESQLRERESYLSAVLDRVPVGLMQT